MPDPARKTASVPCAEYQSNVGFGEAPCLTCGCDYDQHRLSRCSALHISWGRCGLAAHDRGPHVDASGHVYWERNEPSASDGDKRE